MSFTSLKFFTCLLLPRVSNLFFLTCNSRNVSSWPLYFQITSIPSPPLTCASHSEFHRISETIRHFHNLVPLRKLFYLQARLGKPPLILQDSNSNDICSVKPSLNPLATKDRGDSSPCHSPYVSMREAIQQAAKEVHFIDEQGSNPSSAHSRFQTLNKSANLYPQLQNERNNSRHRRGFTMRCQAPETLRSMSHS